MAYFLPGKNGRKGKMYLVEVESGKESTANSIFDSLFNPRPRMQSKAQMTPPPDLVAAAEKWRKSGKHPGCFDKDGILHTHGEIFYRDARRGRGCKVCYCDNGKKSICSHHPEDIDQFANVSTNAIKDLFNCKNESPECGWSFRTYEYEDEEDESIYETFKISKCDSCSSCSEEHGYNCTRNVKDACECGAVKEGETYSPKDGDCNTCVCKAFGNEILQNFTIFIDG